MLTECVHHSNERLNAASLLQTASRRFPASGVLNDTLNKCTYINIYLQSTSNIRNDKGFPTGGQVVKTTGEPTLESAEGVLPSGSSVVFSVVFFFLHCEPFVHILFYLCSRLII